MSYINYIFYKNYDFTNKARNNNCFSFIIGGYILAQAPFDDTTEIGNIELLKNINI